MTRVTHSWVECGALLWEKTAVPSIRSSAEASYRQTGIRGGGRGGEGGGGGKGGERRRRQMHSPWDAPTLIKDRRPKSILGTQPAASRSCKKQRWKFDFKARGKNLSSHREHGRHRLSQDNCSFLNLRPCLGKSTWSSERKFSKRAELRERFRKFRFRVPKENALWIEAFETSYVRF